jgi:predicted phage terminase large subunit-like protein
VIELEGTPSLTILSAEICRRKFREFVRESWHTIENETLQWEPYLDAICDHLVYVFLGDIKNLIISIPPRFLKSTLVSVIWPAWIWANNPKIKFLTGSYEIGLATRDALRMRDMVQSPWYRARFGSDIILKLDQNEKNLFVNNAGGQRMAVSVGGRLTGFGGDYHIVDDPHNIQDINSDTKRETAVRWYKGPLRTRVNNPSQTRRVLIAQRSHSQDLTGELLATEGKKYVHLCLPNEFRRASRCVTRILTKDGTHGKLVYIDPRKAEGQLLSPDRLTAEATLELKDGMTEADYSAQFQQDPNKEGGYILKRSYWQPWVNPSWHENPGMQRELPEFYEKIQLYDTAFEEGEENDYSARLTLGIFRYTPEVMSKVRLPDGRMVERAIKKPTRNCAILLGAWRDKVSFPVLRALAKKSNDKANPDWILIEKKASGHSLIQEMRRGNMPVLAVKIDGDGDKISRAHTASLSLEKGCLFYLPNEDFSKPVMDECADFPKGKNDDWVDCLLMGLMWLRKRDGVQFEEEAGTIRLFRPRKVKGIGTA